MKIEFFGNVDDGRLHIYNRNAFVSLLKNFDGKEIKRVTVRRVLDFSLYGIYPFKP